MFTIPEWVVYDIVKHPQLSCFLMFPAMEVPLSMDGSRGLAFSEPHGGSCWGHQVSWRVTWQVPNDFDVFDAFLPMFTHVYPEIQRKIMAGYCRDRVRHRKAWRDASNEAQNWTRAPGFLWIGTHKLSHADHHWLPEKSLYMQWDKGVMPLTSSHQQYPAVWRCCLNTELSCELSWEVDTSEAQLLTAVGAHQKLATS